MISPIIEEPFHFPGLLNTSYYSQEGDVNIGAIVIMTTNSRTNPSGACSEEVEKPKYALEVTEAVAFATHIVNKNPNLLPNVTMGFTIRGSCPSVGVSIATALSFLPWHRHCKYTDSAACLVEDGNSTSFHDVIGLLGPGYSSLAVPMSSLYAVARLPMVGSTETSDELSDKTTHPYYFRVVSPNLYEVSAVLKFVSSNGWSYVSVLYMDDAYGRNAFDNLNRKVETYGVCVATSHGLRHSTDYHDVVRDLLVHSRARAVVLFVFGLEFQRLLEAIVDQNAEGNLIFVGWIEGIGELLRNSHHDTGKFHASLAGTFVFYKYSAHTPSFNYYLQNLNVMTSKNPWMNLIWENLFNCSFARGLCSNETNVTERLEANTFMEAPLYFDAVLTYAHAVHDLLVARCPNARGEAARACITGELLREYLKTASFDGFLGKVEFDANQEVQGKYVNSQVQFGDQSPNFIRTRRLVLKTVSIYDSRTDKIVQVKNSSIDWAHFKPVERILPWTNSSLPAETPESVCSRPCMLGEYKIEKEVSCCWDCRRCRDNERLVDGNTSCEACPPFTWPDPTSGFTSCVDIPLTFSTLEDLLAILITACTCLAVLLYFCTISGYVIYRDRRVIKASSRELSSLQLTAILAGYVTILLFLTKPTDGLCSAIYFLFCMSFVQLYAPLLVKTIRIFRIFQSVKTNKQQLRFISPGSQMFVTGSLITGQIAMCAASYVYFPPSARRSQPVWSEKLVELSCDLTLPGLASFLVYNMVLVCLCSVLAVKVRKLPDNFNESQLVAMCVSTTLLIWLAFVPTYFTASRQHVRTFLLSTALLLNHSVALVFLFVPKVYAAAFLPQETGKVVSAQRK